MYLFRFFFSYDHIKSIEVPKYYHLIDCFRTCAALAVVLHHYQHFYFFGGSKNTNSYLTSANISEQPFYQYFYYLYEAGAAGVHFFWVISGFIFASVYFSKKVTGKEFFISRFARLYPLHFLTLMVILCLQIISSLFYGFFQIYEFNDVKHFVLNMFFMSSWGFESGVSYNGPIWSVSVEILVYLVFFMIQKRLFKYGILLPLLLCVSFLAISVLKVFEIIGLNPNIALCGFFFFTGSCIFHVNQVFKHILGGAFIFLIAILGISLTTYIVIYFLSPSYLIYVIPFLIMLLLNIENYNFNIFKKISWVGNLSYGIYLWHVPLQILIMLFLYQYNFATRIEFLSSNYFFIGYIVLLLLLSHIGFKYFENPIRKKINDKLS